MLAYDSYYTMRKKYTISVLLLFVIGSIASCTSGCVTIKYFGSSGSIDLPRKSFTQIQHAVTLEACQFDPETKKEKCQKAVGRSVSSGAYVFISEVSSDVAYVLTAGHSCQNKVAKKRMVDGYLIKNLGSEFRVVNLDGSSNKAEVVSINKRYDLCLLRISNVLIKRPILKTAKNPPKPGEEAYNMAAPHGLFWPNSVLLFRGLFSGYHTSGYSVYTIPTKPGSSGSPILNKAGELIGVIFAGYPSMENIGLSSPLVAIKVFLKKSIALGEMQLWEQNNRPAKGKTTIGRWMRDLNIKLQSHFK